MGKLDGKVVLITGAARGQGRSHAIRLAEEGADIVAVDICQRVEDMPYAMGTEDDLAQTAQEVEAVGGRILTLRADVRDYPGMEQVVSQTLAAFGHIDVVVANASICSFVDGWEVSPEQWQRIVDVNLTGAFNTVRAALPPMVERDQSGSLIMVSSGAGLAAFPNLLHYTAAKHGVTGLSRALSLELAQHNIRANSIHPGLVDTPMVQNDAFYGFVGVENREQASSAFMRLNALPIPWVEPIDVSNAVLWFASDESRYVTGVALPVDAGSLQPYRIPHAPAAASAAA